MNLDIKRDILYRQNDFDLMMINRNEFINSSEVQLKYNSWNSIQAQYEYTTQQLNTLSKSKNANRDVCKDLSNKSKELKDLANFKKQELDDLISRIPNFLDKSVPIGKNSDDNVVLEYCNAKPVIENPIHHEDIAINLGFWARNEAIKMSGSRFIILKDKLAKLERVLAYHALSFLTDHGFTELSIPNLVQKEAMYNTGQLPKFDGAFFGDDNYCLIPTGEVPLVNYFAGKTIQDNIIVTTLSDCFRKEPGSLGRDTKGLIRLHQFKKVEMVAVVKPEDSESMHLQFLSHIKSILNSLSLHYRVVNVCSGDIGFTANKQFDVEVWMPSYNKYVEVASCSNCGDFQARRMNLKYHADNNKVLAHTLNGTGLACGRIVAAILENFCYNNQFHIPKVLQQYF